MNAIAQQIIRGNNRTANLDEGDEPLRILPRIHSSDDDAKTILVVDDQPGVCDVAATILNHFGYHARTATSGEEAKSIAQKDPGIDLLVTDIEMPGMRRGELSEWFPMTCPETPVVFISNAAVTSHFREYCYFVESPFVHLDQFLKTIREALDYRGEDLTGIFHAA